MNEEDIIDDAEQTEPTVTEEEFWAEVAPNLDRTQRAAQLGRWAMTGRVVQNQDGTINKKYLDSELARQPK